MTDTSEKLPKKPKGYYLGLPCMRGGVMQPTKPTFAPPEARNCSAFFSCDVLLAAQDWRELLRNWFSALALGAHLVLWLSDCRYLEPPEGHARVTLDDVLEAFTGGTVHEATVIDGHAFIVIENTGFSPMTNSAWKKKPRHALVARTGAHGDALMASSILPGLKEQGYAITFLTRQSGYDMLRHDPHIENFIVLGDKQLHDDELIDFWAAWSPRFDRVVNLTGTVEDHFLKRNGRGDFLWPEDQRRALCSGSYLDYTHKAARIQKPYRVKFYPNTAESRWATETAKTLGKFIIWSLQGGAVHKWWPYAPQAICRLLAHTDYKIVLCGDASAHQQAWDITQAAKDFYGSAERLRSLVNVKSLRGVIALAQHAHIVIGPETALTNAVCLEPMHKIVFLSHSAASNLTDDWVNTKALVPTTTCYPCHRMHYDHQFCPQDKATGAAACAASIPADRLVEAVLLVQAKTKLHHEAKKAVA